MPETSGKATRPRTGLARALTAGRWLPLMATAAWLGAAAPASAYCVARACDPDNGDSCKTDPVTGCSMEGVRLYRADGCVYVAVQAGAAQRAFNMSDAEFEEAVLDAFAAWASADCGHGPPSIEVQSLGAVDVDGPFSCFGPRSDNVDVWSPRDDLSAAVSATSGATAGVTHTKIFQETGEIYDADVSLNELWFWLFDDEDRIRDFLRVVATHEAGHALGMAHSLDKEALMFREYKVTRNRELTDDDVEGICQLFPPMSLSCPPPQVPKSGIDPSACAEKQAEADDTLGGPRAPLVTDPGGCALASIGKPRTRKPSTGKHATRRPWIWASGLGGLAWIWLERRRQRRRRTRATRDGQPSLSPFTETSDEVDAHGAR